MELAKFAVKVIAVIAVCRVVEQMIFPTTTSDATKNAANAKITAWLP